MQKSDTTTSQQIKREIQEVRYAIALAAAKPDSQERLDPLYDQLTALYARQESLNQNLNGTDDAERTENASWN